MISYSLILAGAEAIRRASCPWDSVVNCREAGVFGCACELKARLALEAAAEAAKERV